MFSGASERRRLLASPDNHSIGMVNGRQRVEQKLLWCAIAISNKMKTTIKPLVLTAILVALSAPAHAQQREKIGRVAFLGFNDPNSSKEFIEAFRTGIRELGYVEDRTI